MMLAAKYNKEKNKKNLIEAALNKMGISDKLKSKVYELSGWRTAKGSPKKYDKTV